MTEQQPTPTASTQQAVGPRTTRWTHIALPCTDIDRTIAWYERYTPLQLLDRRTDADGQGAWLGHPDQGENPFILVLACFNRDKDGPALTTMAPFAHIGFEMASRAEVDDGRRPRRGRGLPVVGAAGHARPDRLHLRAARPGRQHDRVQPQPGCVREGPRGLGLTRPGHGRS